jgi:hypothetical protein
MKRKDYHAEAKENEPKFILLGRDPIGPIVVRLWAHFSEVHKCQPLRKIDEAVEIACAMESWRAAECSPSRELFYSLVQSVLSIKSTRHGATLICILCNGVDGEHKLDCPVIIAKLCLEEF